MKEKKKLLTEQEREFTTDETIDIVKVNSSISSMKRDDVVKLWYTVLKSGIGKWPEALPIKPEGFESLCEMKQYKWRELILEMCRQEVGLKALKRYQYKLEKGLTEQEFEDLWDDQRAHLLEERMQELYEAYERRSARSDSGNNSYRLILFIAAFIFGSLLAHLIFGLICAFALAG